MRTLIGHDLFAACRIVKKLNLREDLIALFNNDLEVEDLGRGVFSMVVDKMGEDAAEGLIFSFLSGPLEKTADDLREMDLLDLIGEVKRWASEVGAERWRDFFTQLSGLTR